MSLDEEFVGHTCKAASLMNYVIQERNDPSEPVNCCIARFVDTQLGAVTEGDKSGTRFLALLSACKKLHDSWQMKKDGSA